MNYDRPARQLQQHAQARDQAQADAFWAKMRLWDFRAHQFLWVDETSKDMRALTRSFGYALRGSPPIGKNGLAARGERVSALCSFDIGGFVCWEYTDGTYNRDAFLLAAETVIVRFHLASDL